MEVFKITSEGYLYAIASENEELAKDHILSLVSDLAIDSVEDIPESNWDAADIKMYEDNDTETEPFYVSIRDLICGKEPQLLYTNDYALID